MILYGIKMHHFLICCTCHGTLNLKIVNTHKNQHPINEHSHDHDGVLINSQTSYIL